VNEIVAPVLLDKETAALVPVLTVLVAPEK
jgi:hypothetical protein